MIEDDGVPRRFRYPTAADVARVTQRLILQPSAPTFDFQTAYNPPPIRWTTVPGTNVVWTQPLVTQDDDPF